jgi:hypothetical protein
MALTKATTAMGLVSLLREERMILISYALRNLEHYVPEFWAEIAEHISEM